MVASNTMDRQFEVDAPDKVWVTDITYIKTDEGWLYLSVVIDLFWRRVVGCSAQPRMTTDLALQAFQAAVWRRKPKARVMIHSDQGSQFSSRQWQLFLGQHNLDASTRRRSNCHDDAVAESFFQLVKRERIRRRTYLTREAARRDVFDYIEKFCNPMPKHTNNGMLSPVDFENRQQKLNEAGVYETRGTSGTEVLEANNSLTKVAQSARNRATKLSNPLTPFLKGPASCGAFPSTNDVKQSALFRSRWFGCSGTGIGVRLPRARLRPRRRRTDRPSSR